MRNLAAIFTLSKINFSATEPLIPLEPHLLPTLIILERQPLDSYGLLLILELRRAVRQSLLRWGEPGIERKGLPEGCRCPIVLIE
jgi:hypothetical protein